MNTLVKHILLMLVFVLAQSLFVSLMSIPELYAWPKIFPMFILLLPFGLPRLGELLIALAFGLVLDWAQQLPPGGSSFTLACLVVLRKPWVTYISRQSNSEFFQELRFTRQGMGWLLSYLLPLSFAYELVYYVLIDFGVGQYTLLKVLGSGLASMLWVCVLTILFFRKKQLD